MIGLQHLDDNLKYLIDNIITRYQLDLHYMEDDIDGVTYGPGIYFNDVFSDDHTLIKFITIDNKIAINIYSQKLEYVHDNDAERNSFVGNNSALLHAKFIEAIHFVKWMYVNNLIYFTKEKQEISTIPSYNNCTPICKSINWFIDSESISEFIISHYNSRIIPSPYLISFYENKFKTEEQIQFEQQKEISEKALKRAKYNNWIAIGIALFSTFVASLVTWWCAENIPVTINDEQHKELIENIKFQNK